MLGGKSTYLVQVQLECPVQSPILSNQSGNIRSIDSEVIFFDGVIMKESDGIQNVLFGQLDNLQLCHEQIRHRERLFVDGEAIAKVERMAHVHAINKYIDFTLIEFVIKQQTLVAMPRVKRFIA